MITDDEYKALLPHVQTTARNVAGRFRGYANRHDAEQEIWMWLARGERAADMVSHLDEEPSEVVNVLWRVGRRYAEHEKAQTVGYHPSDVSFYSIDRIEELLPKALDETWSGDGYTDWSEPPSSGNPAEGANELASVCDVRRAVKHVGTDPRRIQEFLGGERPMVGRNRRLSNRESQALLSVQWNGAD